ncbi:hypothetical protein BIV57_15840 [Mangrovactinospora gilvigrisea]|uniref:HTH araC/xylS-type domain-containing protein n=1 Tax=Mangrovactinospora gilvigrisea TaxID=1428644 RepID=A0A1J7BCV7_9ACTN|nr:hypothetical protein BIV57_15840 [Mangrovactinospora gilvigrisea]
MAVGTPHARLRPGVLAYHGYRLSMARPRPRLELPDGVATLLLSFAGNPVVVTSPTGAFEQREYTSMIAGLRTGPRLGTHDGRLFGMDITMAPWLAHRLMRVRMDELADVGLDPAEVAGRWVERLRDRLAEAPGWAARFAVLDEELTARLTEDAAPASVPDRRVVWAFQTLAHSGGRVRIGRLADRLGWTDRQLQKRFRDGIGLPPKGVARVARLQHAMRLLEEGLRGAAVAEECGFFDQAHFNREFRAMTGLAPGKFLEGRRSAEAATRSGGQVDRVQGEVTSLLL